MLSDLHIGTKARGKDLCPKSNNNWLDVDYKNDFISFLKAKPIKADYLIVSGDISNEGKISEFNLARSFIYDVGDVLGVDSSNVILIPGNHDVDWSIIDLGCGDIEEVEFRKRARYDAIQKGLNVSDFAKGLYDDPYFVSWVFDDLYVVGYNSAWHDERDISQHHGLILPEIIGRMGEEIDRLSNNAVYKIFVLHHHPIMYDNMISQDYDFSIMQNSPALIDMLAKKCFDMVIHGHFHIPKISTIDINSIHPLSFLCAGSFSCILDQRWNGKVLNMFHVVNIEGKDADSLRSFGYVENYSYLSDHKWVKSKLDNSGVRHRHNFGSYASLNVLVEKIRDRVNNMIDEKGYARWSQLCESDRVLKYNTPEFVDQLINKLCEELDLDFIDNDVEIVLIKK